ncbi:MAG: glycosyltransferase, partial [Actinomycetota bacterium]
GYVSETDKADLLAGAEVMAFPSLYEGFGLPVLEAMQAGVPVVSTRVGAIPEVAGRSAILVEPQDPSALAGALLSVVEDSGLRERLAESGREQAAGYSWETTVERLVETYHQLTGHPVARPDAMS